MDSVESRLHGTLLGLREQVLEFGSMRTIEIDESLMRKAMRVSGTKTKRATVEAALQLLIRTKARAGMRRLRGRSIGTVILKNRAWGA